MTDTAGALWFGIYDTVALPDTTPPADSSGWIFDNGHSMVANDQWHHVAVVFARDGNAATYVDGKRDTTLDISALAAYPLDDFVFCIGNDRYDASSAINGALDEVRVQRHVMNEQWIKLCYESQRAGGTVVKLE